MKFPSRWEQPGDARAVLRHRPAGGLPALCCPSPPVHTAWEETPPTPSLPAMPTVTYFLGTTARLGPFFGFRGHLPRVEHCWSTLPAANILLLLFCAGPPAWKLQAEQGHFFTHSHHPALACEDSRRADLTAGGPSWGQLPEAKIVLHPDLSVVLACQRQPLREVSSPSLKAQNWTAKPSVLSWGGDDLGIVKGPGTLSQAQAGPHWIFTIHTKAGHPTAPWHPSTLRKESPSLKFIWLLQTSLFPPVPPLSHLPCCPFLTLRYGMPGEGRHILEGSRYPRTQECVTEQKSKIPRRNLSSD